MEPEKKGSVDQRETMASSQGFYSTNNLFMNTVGLSSNISSSTLRHTAPQISFPKANRFHTQSQIQVPTKIELPSQLGHRFDLILRQNRYTQQGFGNKILFQYQWQKSNAQDLPSPDRYDVRQEPGTQQVKKSFGLSWEVYSKTYIPSNKNIPPEVAKFLPGNARYKWLGPGEYQVRKEFGQHKYQFQLKGKGKMFNEQRENGVPGPDVYKPITTLISPSRFSKISQGVGEKKNPFVSNSFTPGPGRYDLGSAFDKVAKRREFLTRQGERRPFI